MVEQELDSLEAFAKGMETDDSGDSGFVNPFSTGSTQAKILNFSLQH